MDVEPIDVLPVISADLSQLGLEVGKAYTVTLNISADGTQTASMEEIIPLPVEPTSDTIVMRAKNVPDSPRFLGTKSGLGWSIAFSHYGDWAEVVKVFSPEFFTIVEVVI